MGPTALSYQATVRNFLNLCSQRPEYIGLSFSLLCLSAYFAAGERGLITATVVTPPLGLFLFRQILPHVTKHSDTDEVTGLNSIQVITQRGQKRIIDCHKSGRKMACFAICLDGFAEFQSKHGESAAQQAQRAATARILRILREDDLLTRTGNGVFLLACAPANHLDLDICVKIATRIKSALDTALPFDATTARFPISIGFSRSDQIEQPVFAELSDAAQLAMNTDSRNGYSHIRAFSTILKTQDQEYRALRAEAAKALERNQIAAWFQPQISADTGAIVGFETMARWQHPERGILGLAEVIDVLAQSGQLESLTDLMLQQALLAQQTWDKNGIRIPHVGVNFAAEELSKPMLVEKIQWELDRFNVAPNRLSIEVLETVTAETCDSAIAHNVNGLAGLGCNIDLDDFGTGHASIGSIRRFAVARLKIDRSFVKAVDQDPEQQKLVSAILTMAERLGIATLAAGVETSGERAMLRDLGCGHLQGSHIARPMPFEQTIPWITKHVDKSPTPSASRLDQQNRAGTESEQGRSRSKNKESA